MVIRLPKVAGYGWGATLTLSLLVTGLTACASTATRTGSATASATASEAEWRALASPRARPLPGAARVSLDDIRLVGVLPWPAGAPVAVELGVVSLAEAGLLRRPDVHFVERRRFTPAAAAERAGVARPVGAPSAGVSPQPEFIANAVWVALAGDASSVEIRLESAQTGAVATTSRVELHGAVDAITVARAVVEGVLQALDGAARRPDWEDPVAPPGGTTASDPISTAALLSYLHGFAAEESWNWEAARHGYQAAARDPRLYEATATLARTARLRTGGTLGES